MHRTAIVVASAPQSLKIEDLVVSLGAIVVTRVIVVITTIYIRHSPSNLCCLTLGVAVRLSAHYSTFYMHGTKIERVNALRKGNSRRGERVA